MSDGKIKVLYIAGNGRSGSTILDVILGQIDGFFAIGEVRRAWDRDVIEDSLCGCGESFRACPTWSAIFDDAYGGFPEAEAARMSASIRKLAAQKRLLTPTMGRRPFPWEGEELRRCLGTLEKLYASIARVTGSRVIVDASKWPLYGYMLGQLPNVELYVLHLVRDPRAVAFSWTRRKEFQPGVLLPRQHPVKTTAYWLALNPAIRFFWNRAGARNYYFLPYERLVASPRFIMQDILDFVGEDVASLPFLDERTVALHHTHAVAGNEVRLNRGEVKLRLDDEWRRKMPPASRMIVSAMTWPFLLRYGYMGERVAQEA